MQMMLCAAAIAGASAAEVSPQSFLRLATKSDLNDVPLIPQITGGYSGEPEGGSDPFAGVKEQVEWSDESSLSKPVQYLFVFLWIFMLAAIPFAIPILDQRPVTQTQKVVGCTMLVVLFGGFWLFTNIILFQSGHFKQIRPLTSVECIYFMSQIITTVGYGDITPAKTRGQVFVGLYVLGALFVIAMLVSDMTTHMIQMAKEYRSKRAQAAAMTDEARQGAADSEGQAQQICSLTKLEKPSAGALLTSLAVFTSLQVCWILFFSLHPGEGKTVFQALYMSVITLSTVGFGFFTPVTEAGMIFGSFFMLLGAGALANVIGNFTTFMVKMNEYEHSERDGKEEAVQLLKDQLSGGSDVTELQFLRFCLLQTKLASNKELENMGAMFKNLKPKQGQVSFKAIEEALELTDAALPDKAK